MIRNDSQYYSVKGQLVTSIISDHVISIVSPDLVPQSAEAFSVSFHGD